MRMSKPTLDSHCDGPYWNNLLRHIRQNHCTCVSSLLYWTFFCRWKYEYPSTNMLQHHYLMIILGKDLRVRQQCPYRVYDIIAVFNMLATSSGGKASCYCWCFIVTDCVELIGANSRVLSSVEFCTIMLKIKLYFLIVSELLSFPNIPGAQNRVYTVSHCKPQRLHSRVLQASEKKIVPYIPYMYKVRRQLLVLPDRC